MWEIPQFREVEMTNNPWFENVVSGLIVAVFIAILSFFLNRPPLFRQFNSKHSGSNVD